MSLGAKERLEEAADLEACKKQNMEIVRRQTGGRAVLHYKELTYSLTGSAGRPPFNDSVLNSYHRIAEALRKGLADLGANLELTSGARRARGVRLPCFAAPSRFELAYKGRKVVGSAQRRLRRSVLQHGSILLESDPALLALATGAGPEREPLLADAMIGLREILQKPVSREDVIKCLVPHLNSILQINLEASELSENEKGLVDELLDQDFAGVEKSDTPTG